MKIHQSLPIIISLLVSICFAQPTTISVLDFQAEGISVTEASVLTNRFRAELVNIGTYLVIERAQMEEVLREQGFQQSGCVTNECVVEVGQLLGAQQMVGGNIGRVADVFTVTAKIIDVRTAEILSVTTYDHQGDIGSLLKTGMRQVALDMFSRQAVASVQATMNTGDLFVSTDPEGARVILDGRTMGYSPLLVEKLFVGVHEVQVRMPGYLSRDATAEITIDDVDTVRVPLVSIAGIQARLDRNHHRQQRLLIGGAGALLLGRACLYLADKSYEDYLIATQDVEAIYTRVKILDGVSVVMFGSGTAAAVYAGYLQIRQILMSWQLKGDS